MSDEAVVDGERKDASTNKWDLAIKVGLALIAIFIFKLIIIIVLSDYLRPLWAFWTIFDSGRYPVYDAIFYLFYGVFLLLLADLFVMNKIRIEALLDDLQLTINKAALNYLLIGLIIGSTAIIAINIAKTLSGAYVFNGFLYVDLITENLAMAALFIIPLLVHSVGHVALARDISSVRSQKIMGW
jgi:hypothetical protein